MLGSDLGKLLVVAVIVSGISSAQTTILPGSRTSLSMAAAGALPKAFARIHPRYLTPAFGTIVVGALATLWYVPGRLISENFLFDSLSALSLLIAFYYGLTGIACAIYWRHELTALGEELPLHRRRAAGRRRDALLPAVSSRRATSPTRRPPTRAARSSGSACRW